MLFHDTIYHNIAYGDLNASRESVEEAAKLAEVHHSILNMPNGYDTMVCEWFVFKIKLIYKKRYVSIL